jgi:hypothetical protein
MQVIGQYYILTSYQRIRINLVLKGIQQKIKRVASEEEYISFKLSVPQERVNYSMIDSKSPFAKF